MKFSICHMYPDVLNLYGDRGNIICLVNRLKWRGIEASVTPLPIGERARLSDFDLVFIGGGQDFEQQVLLDDLHRGKAEEIKASINDGLTFLAVCGGYQMLGQYYETRDHRRCGFIGALELYTVSSRRRMIGNMLFDAGDGIGEVVGFENHSGKTYLGGGVKPLGRVISGFGNNGRDGTEGARYLNVFGTYSHGPVLPKNPRLCDYILRTALNRRYDSAVLSPLDDGIELSAHDEAAKLLR